MTPAASARSTKTRAAAISSTAAARMSGRRPRRSLRCPARYSDTMTPIEYAANITVMRNVGKPSRSWYSA